MNDRQNLTVKLVIAAVVFCAVIVLLVVPGEKPVAVEEETKEKQVEKKLPVVIPVKKEAKPTPSPEAEKLKKVHSHSVNCLHRTSSRTWQAATFPVAASVQCGTFYNFGGKNLNACITRSTKDGLWETVIIDLNQNADFTDDQVFELPAPEVTEKIVIENNGKSHLFNATMVHARTTGILTLHHADCWSGVATLAEEKAKWVACDCNLSGKLDAGDMTYLDTNGNGIIEDRRKDRTIPLGADALLVRKNKWYEVIASADNRVSINPYKGPMSRWTIDHSQIVEDKNARHTLTVSTSMTERVVLHGVNPTVGVLMPARTWRSVIGMIRTEPKPIRYVVSNVDLKKDSTLKLEKPFGLVTLTQNKGMITVGQKVAAPQGVRYTVMRTKPGPIVEIFSENQPDKPIIKGTIKYGSGDYGRYVTSIPETVKKGEKLTVRVTITTDPFFGVIKGEETITVE